MKTRRFHVFNYHVTSCKELKQETKKLKEEKEVISKDLAQWKKNFKNLEAESQKLFEEMKNELARKDEVIEELNSANEQLQSYVDCLAKSEGITYQGKKVSEVKKKSRTLKCFVSCAKIALWFAESFGLEISSRNVVENSTRKVHTVSLSGNNTPSTRVGCNDNEVCDESHGFDALSDNEKNKVEEILFLVDKFYVSNEFYHEVTMLNDSLPRSYLIKQRRDQLNKLISISKTPGIHEGCQVDFEHTLRNRNFENKAAKKERKCMTLSYFCSNSAPQLFALVCKMISLQACGYKFCD